MLWAPPDPAPVASCPAAFSHLLKRASEQAELGFLCAPALANPAQRDRVLRQAYGAAMLSRDKSAALRFIGLVKDQPWLGEVNFFDAVQLAALAGPSISERLLTAAAIRNPSLAIREVAGYWGLAGAARAFDRAVLLSPAESVMIARGVAPTSAAVRSAMAASTDSRVAWLHRLTERQDVSDLVRQRLAVLPDVPPPVLESDSGYLMQLASRRPAATGDDAVRLDRALAAFAQMLFVEARQSRAALDRLEPHAITPAAVWLLMSYGRTESDDPSFNLLFDHLLAPKLRGASLDRLLAETHGLGLRQFLTSAITHRRFESLLSLAASDAARMVLLSRAVTGLEAAERPTEEAVAAAEIIDNVSGRDRLAHIAGAIAREYPKQPPLYGLLAVRLRQRGYASPPINAIAARYERFLRAPGRLPAATLFDSAGLCVQRHFFYDDQDGVESFANFRHTFQRSGAWTWEDRGGWVLVTGRGAGGRRILMAASIPIDLLAPGNSALADQAAARQAAVTRHLATQSLTPTVVVHRGHSYHVEKTIRHLNDTARLVLLGSCRGTEDVDAVMAAAPSAQLIATRSVGTETVNDPLLDAINGELLRGAESLDWDALWARQRMGASAAFADYIPPNRNSAAIFLAAYNRYLAAE